MVALGFLAVAGEWFTSALWGSGDASAAGCVATSGQQSGVDVNASDGPVNFASVAASGVKFVYAKATQGDYDTDSSYSTNDTQAKAAGLAFGAFAVFDPTLDPTTQADYFLNVARVAAGDLIPAVDVASDANGGPEDNGGGVSAAVFTSRLQTWLNVVQSALGVRPLIFGDTSQWDTSTGSDTAFGSAGYPLWIAYYGADSPPPLPDGWTTWAFWEYGGLGSVAEDYFNGAYDGGNLCAMTVSNPQSTSAPVVSAVSPRSGPVAGGTPVTITGTNFVGASSVTFGRTPAASFTVVSASEITAISPPGPSSTVDVVVTTTQGASPATAADDFTYLSGGGPSEPPASAALPVITGIPEAGHTLSCSEGAWTNDPTRFSYQWAYDGTPIQGAVSSAYTVQSGDEQLTLTCAVIASNAKGDGPSATSAGVSVAVPHVAHCPPASGSLSGETLGRLKLGMTRAQALHAFAHSSNRGKKYEDFFCLTPRGVRVGIASPKLIKTLPKAERKLAGRVIWASTSSYYYTVQGVRVGATVAAASQHVKLTSPFDIGKNDWYLAPNGASTAVLKVRGGIIEEIGIAEKALTQGRRAQRTFLVSFT
jgi:GH25 family lysozyme M1 (1,4-beta-N-acetylmuramidase)